MASGGMACPPPLGSSRVPRLLRPCCRGLFGARLTAATYDLARYDEQDDSRLPTSSRSSMCVAAADFLALRAWRAPGVPEPSVDRARSRVRPARRVPDVCRRRRVTDQRNRRARLARDRGSGKPLRYASSFRPAMARGGQRPRVHPALPCGHPQHRGPHCAVALDGPRMQGRPVMGTGPLDCLLRARHSRHADLGPAWRLGTGRRDRGLVHRPGRGHPAVAALVIVLLPRHSALSKRLVRVVAFYRSSDEAKRAQRTEYLYDIAALQKRSLLPLTACAVTAGPHA